MVGGAGSSRKCFFFNDTATTEIYTLSLHDALPISQSSNKRAESQAALSILGIFIDNFICTLSILVLLMSSIWQMGATVEGSKLIQLAFSKYFPHMNIFMPIFLLLTGYSTIIAYFAVGIKCAEYLNPKKGEKIYYVYAVFSLILFSFFSQRVPLLVMSLSGGALITINLIGIFLLRDKISAPFQEKKATKGMLVE